MTGGFKALLLALLAWFIASRVAVRPSMRELGFAFSLLALLATLWFDVKRVAEDDARIRWWRVLASASVAFAVLCDAMQTVLARGAFSAWTRLSLLGVGGLGLLVRSAWERRGVTRAADPAVVARHLAATFRFGAAVLALAALNLGIFQHDRKLDVSFSPATRPSAQVVAQLKKLKEPLEIVLFLDPSSGLWPALKPYFSALEALSAQLRVRVTEASREPELVREHRVRGNGWGLLRLASRAETFELGRDLAHARTTLKMLDSHVANHLSALLIDARRVYLTHGHGERSLIGDVEESRGRRLTDFERLLARFNLRISRLGVAEGLGHEVPRDAALVLVLGPERAFLAEEAAALDRYVARGGHVWLALEPSVDAGLSGLFERVGVFPRPGVVLCRESHLIRNRTDADRELIVARDFDSHTVTRLAQRAGKRDGVIFVRAGGLRVERARSTNAAPLLEASADCFVDVDGDFQQSAREADATPTLAVAWEGEHGAKVFMVGDGDLATDQVLRNDANTFLTMGALSWLVGSDVLAVAVLPDEEMPIVHERSEDRLWFYATSFAMPAAIFALGLTLARRRTHKSTF
jgi:hypothetical protein